LRPGRLAVCPDRRVSVEVDKNGSSLFGVG
jgi:hypothetical protein